MLVPSNPWPPVVECPSLILKASFHAHPSVPGLTFVHPERLVHHRGLELRPEGAAAHPVPGLNLMMDH